MEETARDDKLKRAGDGPAEGSLTSTVEPHTPKDLRILVVDDNSVSRSLLQLFLERYGTCDLASTGPEALTAFYGALHEGRPYHLVCLDIQMPDMDGLGVLEAIRGAEADGEGPARSVRVLMTTAFDEKDLVEQALRLGSDGYIVKPLRLEKIAARLKELDLIA